MDEIWGALGCVGAVFGRLAMVLLAVIIPLVALEAAARFTLDPVDYLLPDLVHDERLGHRVVSGSAYHDDWGFRNRAVPETASIVAIGDSMTYGWNARARDSWPAQLARMTGTDVYNLAMGDYGPGQYLALLEDYAVRLAPERVLIGLYLGNDLVDSYKYVYVLGADEERRRDDPRLVAEAAEHQSPTDKLADADTLTRVRGWLARNSILYRLATNSALGGAARLTEARIIARGSSPYSTLVDASTGRAVTLDPVDRLAALDLSDPRVAEGLELTNKYLTAINLTCREHNIDCAVVLIPTKERVYAETATRYPGLKNADALQRLAVEEQAIQDTITAHLDDIGMPYVDTLHALRTTIPDGVYSANQDIHPNSDGYGVIADEVARVLGLD
ncbi:MAG: SGNH/GDSL hydrolase family protein [Anaerolineae bacterium]|jgi:lysophospholipase L1-like esterase